MSAAGIRVNAIIAAAGFGTRAGGPKLALHLGDGSFLSHIYRTIAAAPVDGIVVVVQERFLDWAQRECPQASVIVNHHPELGMLSSLLLGADRVGHSEGGLLVVPVDHPLIQVETYRTLLSEFRRHPQSVIFPQYLGRSGHPVLIPASLLRNAPSPTMEGGLKALIRHSHIQRIAAPVNDPGVLHNLNYPHDFPSGGKSP